MAHGNPGLLRQGFLRASLLIDTGANPKAIQQVMGHSKIQTTYDVYGRLLPGSYDDVRARMDAYLASSKSDTTAGKASSPVDPVRRAQK